ncbi:hypothetical protein ABEB36_006190 [Hypothenemus hampei]|uniref:Tetraspanin n=1 Tax=Hypothenemus hampei TaxID=57062 RepID=A0ABD1EPQ1_HYPHA
MTAYKYKKLLNPANTRPSDVTVKCGKPIVQVTFQCIKLCVVLVVLLFLLLTLLSVNLLVQSIRIRFHFGTFINMVSKGDGHILPSLLAIPVWLFFCLDILLVLFIYKLFSKKKSPRVNRILFLLIMVAVAMILVTLSVIIAVLCHMYGSNNRIKDGIFKAMEQYSFNTHFKRQIDRMQIELQCCGSHGYYDWFNVTWLDQAISTNHSVTPNGKTPFSCCTIKTHFPCIHFDIESLGLNYYYTPEFNMSISPIGCHQRMVEKKREIGEGIVVGLFLNIFLQGNYRLIATSLDE